MNIKKIIIIHDVEVSYYEQGKGKTILFLHGGRLRAKTFQSLITSLSQHYHVVAPDIPGYGDSSTPQEIWTYQDYAFFFSNFINKLKLDDVTIIGYSMGGGIAYHLAAIDSDISKLILIDSAGIEIGSKSKLRRDLDRLLFYLILPQYFSTFITLIKEHLLFLSKHSFSMNYIHKMRKELELSSSYVKNISVPTILIWAENDSIFPISIAKKLYQSIKGSKLITVNGNHDWVLYKNSEFNKLIINEIGSITA